MSTTKHKETQVSGNKKQVQRDANRDPLSGRAGAHPVGTGIGAATGGVAGGAMTGAAIGTAGGPAGAIVGAAVGAVVGAVSGGLAGKLIAEEINPTFEHGYWRNVYARSTYAASGTTYEEYAPAYQYGWGVRAAHQDKSFEQAESTLQRDWDKVKGASKLGWAEARVAVREGWTRVSKSLHKK